MSVLLSFVLSSYKLVFLVHFFLFLANDLNVGNFCDTKSFLNLLIEIGFSLFFLMSEIWTSINVQFYYCYYYYCGTHFFFAPFYFHGYLHYNLAFSISILFGHFFIYYCYYYRFCNTNRQ